MQNEDEYKDSVPLLQVLSRYSHILGTLRTYSTRYKSHVGLVGGIRRAPMDYLLPLYLTTY